MYFFSADVYTIKRILNINNIFYENYFFDNIFDKLSTKI